MDDLTKHNLIIQRKKSSEFNFSDKKHFSRTRDLVIPVNKTHKRTIHFHFKHYKKDHITLTTTIFPIYFD